MTSSSNPSGASAKPVAAALSREMDAAHATVAQREILWRIEAQRERLAARRSALRQAAALRESASDRVDADASLPLRLLAFARLHPMAVAAVIGVAGAAAGPRKLLRLAGVVLPIVMRMRR